MTESAAAPGNMVSTATSAPHGADPIPTPPEIDIDRLAEKVYRLLLSDLRQEQARRGGRR